MFKTKEELRELCTEHKEVSDVQNIAHGWKREK